VQTKKRSTFPKKSARAKKRSTFFRALSFQVITKNAQRDFFSGNEKG
jgi:hypothetical protein